MGSEKSGSPGELSERKKQILKAIIEAHIELGEPVGSKYLTSNKHIACSSATIRNEMAELESMGYLEQPHTSAGRVPSEAGYRLYVDSLIDSYRLTEREIEAIVEIPNRSGSATKKWAIAKDHIWLMPIPEPGSEAAKTTSEKIYEDAEAALHITDVPYGTEAEIGQPCQDSNVNNALDIIAGMTTDLANHVETVSAAGPAETTLLLDSGVEIAFGKAENIRDKERVILQILEENPDSVAYINVRLVETPTWRSI